ncbi:aldose epimerase family protein [Marinobacter sp. JSM 1782161]|uniref:aldose epimerase family protein n=1 Tax=Marinobacter sp. JSM 1782161 TaxID=2685906 RepID=UPI001402E0CC|nr:aldose epimerase family protein [Marinobacter sp. JSM 1782161]
MTWKTITASLAMAAAVVPTAQAANASAMDRVEHAVFGTLPDGRTADLYRITNSNGLVMEVTNYGGIIVSLKTPDRDGELGDIVLGFADLDGYLSEAYRKANPYFGALIGRYGNRIAGGRFTLNGETYDLATNNGPNHLHGGDRGFNRVLWQAEPFQESGQAGLVLSYTSADGEEGYPGKLDVTVTYALTDANELAIEYQAETTEPTPVNLTQHSYFNLRGEGHESILGHQLQIHADRFTPVDDTLIPTGEQRPVAGTPFDFREPTAIGARINDDNTQLDYGQGYDHNFVLSGEPGEDGLRPAARLEDRASGRVVEIASSEPGIQFYSGNFLDGSLTGKSGQPYVHRSGLALETQHFPDSPNQDGFPSTLVTPDEPYRSRTVYRFSND